MHHQNAFISVETSARSKTVCGRSVRESVRSVVPTMQTKLQNNSEKVLVKTGIAHSDRIIHCLPREFSEARMGKRKVFLRSIVFV